MVIKTTGQPDSFKKGSHPATNKEPTTKKAKSGKKWFFVPAEESGSLRSMGYTPLEPAVSRRKALATAIKEYGATTVFRKLMAVSNVTKKTQPSNSKAYHEDARWVSETYILTKKPKERAKKVKPIKK
jgi:hypothetical protein